MKIGRMILVVLTIGAFAGTPLRAMSAEPVVLALTKEGKSVEGVCKETTLRISVAGKERSLPLQKLLSLHRGETASSYERERITSGLVAIQGNDRVARDSAVTELTEIGLPVLTPLLDSYKDTDNHEPQPLYRLFARIVPSYADTLDRTLDLIRLSNGEALRGKLLTPELHLASAGGQETVLRVSDLRRIAVRRAKVERAFDVHSLHHCTQVEYLDSGVAVTPASKVEAEAQGLTRLSFSVDGWTSDPDGMPKPGPNYKSNLVDGLPFGALVGRIGATGSRWLVGKQCHKSGLEAGRLYLGINDNPHWQNNLGSYRVRMRVSDAYDLGDAQ